MRTVQELLSKTHNPSGWVQAHRAFTCPSCGKECAENSWVSSIWEDRRQWEPDALGEPECEDCELSDIEASKMGETLNDWHNLAFAWNSIWHNLVTLCDYTIEWWEDWSKEGHKRAILAEDVADWVLHRAALSRVVEKGPPEEMAESATFRRYERMNLIVPDDLDMQFTDYMLWELELGAAAITYLRKARGVHKGNPEHPFVQWFVEMQEKNAHELD